MTVPTLIAKYQKEQTVTRLKKAYSTLSQTTNRAIADNGPIESWEVEITDDVSGSEKFYNNYLKNYLNVSKYCGGNVSNDCKFEYKRLDSDTYTLLRTHVLRFYLDDGTFIGLQTTKLGGSVATKDDPKVEIFIDINGQKKPNVMGKDVFFYNYYLRNAQKKIIGKFVPYRYNYATLAKEDCSKSGSGLSCATLIMKAGWRISDDYPW